MAEHSNDDVLDISELLPNPELPPAEDIIFAERLKKGSLDYSLKSLEALDSYLDELRHENLRSELTNRDRFQGTILRCGAYLGEVLRRNGIENYNWYRHSDWLEINPTVKSILGDTPTLATCFVLGKIPDSSIHPIAKVLKRIENGAEDALPTYAKVIIDQFGKAHA